MLIDISKLPPSVQKQLPISIRTFKNIYVFEELPTRVQHTLRDYLNTLPDIQYRNVLDLKSEISEYSDFKTINDYVTLISEYVKNYVLVLPGQYPFDPIFGCRLKHQIQTRDTNLRRTLISAEIDKLVNVITADFDVAIKVMNITIEPTSVGAFTEFNVNIELQIMNTNTNIDFKVS